MRTRLTRQLGKGLCFSWDDNGLENPQALWGVTLPCRKVHESSGQWKPCPFVIVVLNHEVVADSDNHFVSHGAIDGSL